MGPCDILFLVAASNTVDDTEDFQLVYASVKTSERQDCSLKTEQRVKLPR